MCAKKKDYDEEELFAHTRMSLGDHIEELRTYMWRAIKGFLIALIIGFLVAKPVLHFLIAPVDQVLDEMRDERIKKIQKQLKEEDPEVKSIRRYEPIFVRFNKRELANELGLELRDTEADDMMTVTMQFPPAEIVDKTRKIQELVNEKGKLKVFNVTEGFMVWFKVSMYTGFVLASPWIFYQMWMFIAAGLYPHEKQYVHIFMPLSMGLFIAGVCLCQFVVLPRGIRWLLDFSEWLGVEPELRLNEWLGFALLVPLIFGIAFQLPLLMFGLERVGFFDIDTYRSKRRIAIFLIFLISGMANASPDPISMVMLAVPLCALYEVGILLCKTWPKPEIDLDVEDSDEMVEV